MDPGKPEKFQTSDVVRATAGRDQGKLFFLLDTDDQYLFLVNGKDRPLDKPKRKKCKHVQKVLRSETRVALSFRAGDKVLNSELRRDLAFMGRTMQSNNLGG